MLAPLVIVLAIADDVHIVQHFDHELRVSGNKAIAFKSAVTHLFTPLLGASGTTALGMLSLATSDVVAVRAFGIGAADRHHGGLRDLAGVRADAAHDGAAGPRCAAPGTLAAGSTAAGWPVCLHPSAMGRFGRPWHHRRSRTRGCPSARRHQPHQLLSGRPSAVAIGCGRRSPALRHLQLQHPHRRAAGLDLDARHARPHGAAVERSEPPALCQEGDLGRRLREAGQPAAGGRVEGCVPAAHVEGSGGAGAVRLRPLRPRAGRSCRAWWPATSRAPRSRSSWRR